MNTLNTVNRTTVFNGNVLLDILVRLIGVRSTYVRTHLRFASSSTIFHEKPIGFFSIYFCQSVIWEHTEQDRSLLKQLILEFKSRIFIQCQPTKSHFIYTHTHTHMWAWSRAIHNALQTSGLHGLFIKWCIDGSACSRRSDDFDVNRI